MLPRPMAEPLAARMKPSFDFHAPRSGVEEGEPFDTGGTLRERGVNVAAQTTAKRPESVVGMSMGGALVSRRAGHRVADRRLLVPIFRFDGARRDLHEHAFDPVVL